MTSPSTRRELLENATALTSAVASLTIVPRHVLGGAGHVAPSEKMNIAGVGLGDMGPAKAITCWSPRRSSGRATGTPTRSTLSIRLGWRSSGSGTGGA